MLLDRRMNKARFVKRAFLRELEREEALLDRAEKGLENSQSEAEALRAWKTSKREAGWLPQELLINIPARELGLTPCQYREQVEREEAEKPVNPIIEPLLHRKPKLRLSQCDQVELQKEIAATRLSRIRKEMENKQRQRTVHD